MIPIVKSLLAAVVSVIVFGLWKLFCHACPGRFMSPIRHLRGPKASSWIYGSMHDMYIHKHTTFQEEWVREFGNTIKFKGFLLSNWLFTTDTRAINHILNHSVDYQKPPIFIQYFSDLVGKGIFFVEGTQHRQQRYIMNPAFRPAQIGPLTDTLLEKAVRLRDMWSSEVTKGLVRSSTTGVRLNITDGIGKVVTDMLGHAGFNYNFESLNEKPSELHGAVMTLFAAGQRMELRYMLQARFPIIGILPSDSLHKAKIAAQRTMSRVSKQLLSNAKSAALASATEKGKIAKDDLQGRDLLSLLVKANMASDIPDNQRMPDEDVMAQIPTFMVAGHSTTSATMAWALYAITKAPEIQTRLREELLSVDTDNPSMDQLMELPYLDAVVRETLRFYTPVTRTVRFATKDDIVPVEKPYTDKHGVVHNSIRISKGDPILVPIQAINHSTELWGPDAEEFKPERWENIPAAVSQIPGVWSHILSFLGGPRSCVGYRFALVGIKAVLFAVVRAFEFELAVAESEIGKTKSTITQGPTLRNDPSNKANLPLLLKPYKPGYQN